MKSILTGILVLCQVILANAQFTATMFNTVSGKTRTYTVYSDLQNYRYEFERSGEKWIVIVRPEEDKSLALMPDKKFYQSSSCDGVLSRTNDPWQSYLWFKNFGVEKVLGSEKVEGYTCKKLAIYQTETRVYNASYAESLKFPLKISNEIEKDTHMEIREIRSWLPDPEKFKIPEDYTEVDRRLNPVIPEAPAPEIWTVTRASVPYSGTVERGRKLWLSVKESHYYKISIINQTRAPGKLIIHIYKDGSPLPEEEQGPEKYRTFRLFPGETKILTQDWKAESEVLIEPYEGLLELKIERE